MTFEKYWQEERKKEYLSEPSAARSEKYYVEEAWYDDCIKIKAKRIINPLDTVSFKEENEKK